jgi:hypothetical protein
MFMKELVIAGLKRQDGLLRDLISQLEDKSPLDPRDFYMFHERTGEVSQNLKKLRKIKRNYRAFQGASLS